MKWDKSKGRPEPIRLLNKILEIECGEPMVDMSIEAPSLVPMREGSISWCRLTVAQMAEKAARSLPKGIYLGFTDAWRPFVRQQKIYNWMWKCLEEARPGLDYKTKRRIVCKWVAPVDQKAPPGHCTGAAIDVHLQDADGKPLDVTSPFTRFTATPTYVFGLSQEAQRNRDLLVQTMLSVGFSNCRDEYWHYSFGDAGWAVREGLTSCQYGLAELPEELWAESQRVWDELLTSRSNPYLS